MSIIKHLPELPKEGSAVYAEGLNHNDKCIFKDNRFIVGSSSPSPYELTRVTKWFYLDEYSGYFQYEGVTCYQISFDIAEKIEYIKQIEYITEVLSQTEEGCTDCRLDMPTGIDIRSNINDMENNLYELKEKIENSFKEK